MIAIECPENVSSIIKDIELSGKCLKKELHHHITCFYFKDDIEMEKILKIIPIVYDITSKVKPFIISSSKYTSFPKGKYGYPIIAQIKSKELVKLRNDIKKAFNDNDIEFDQKFPNFIPHLTIEYNKDEINDGKFNEVAWQVNNIKLYCGDKNKEQMLVEFTFGNIIKNSSLFVDKFAEHFEKLAIENGKKIIKDKR